MNKQNLSEDDSSAKFITRARHKAGLDEAAIRRHVGFAAGRIIVHGKTKRADYVLYCHHGPIALIEAKHSFKAAGDGMPQALDAFRSPADLWIAPITICAVFSIIQGGNFHAAH